MLDPPINMKSADEGSALHTDRYTPTVLLEGEKKTKEETLDRRVLAPCTADPKGVMHTINKWGIAFFHALLPTPLIADRTARFIELGVKPTEADALYAHAYKHEIHPSTASVTAKRKSIATPVATAQINVLRVVENSERITNDHHYDFERECVGGVQMRHLPVSEIGSIKRVGPPAIQSNVQVNAAGSPLMLTPTAEKLFISALSSLRDISEEEIAAKLRGLNPIQYFNPTTIQAAQGSDEKYKKIINTLLTTDTKKVPARIREKYIMLPTNLLAEKYNNSIGYRIIIPTESAVLLVAAAHGNSHLSTKNVYELLRTYFKISYLNEITTMIGQNCLQCAYNRTSTKREQLAGIILRGRSPLDVISVDHMFLPPNTRLGKTYRYLFTYADTFTRLVIAVPTMTTNSREVIEILRQIFIMNGKPNMVQSDKGSAFTSASYESFMLNEDVKANTYLSYVPQGHAIERFNLLVTQVVKIILTSYHTKNWLKHIIQINDIIRALPQKYTIKHANGTIAESKMSAHEFTYGVPPPRSLDAEINELFAHSRDEKERMRVQSEIQQASANYLDHQHEQQEQADTDYTEKHQSISVGSYILLRREPHHKYNTTYFKMPYRVTHIKGRKVGLVDPWTNTLHPFSVHISRIKKLNINASLFAELPSELRIALGAADALFHERHKDDDFVLPLQSVIRMRRGKAPVKAKKPPKGAPSKSKKTSRTGARARSLRDAGHPGLGDLDEYSTSTEDDDPTPPAAGTSEEEEPAIPTEDQGPALALAHAAQGPNVPPPPPYMPAQQPMRAQVPLANLSRNVQQPPVTPTPAVAARATGTRPKGGANVENEPPAQRTGAPHGSPLQTHEVLDFPMNMDNAKLTLKLLHQEKMMKDEAYRQKLNEQRIKMSQLKANARQLELDQKHKEQRLQRQQIRNQQEVLQAQILRHQDNTDQAASPLKMHHHAGTRQYVAPPPFQGWEDTRKLQEEEEQQRQDLERHRQEEEAVCREVDEANRFRILFNKKYEQGVRQVHDNQAAMRWSRREQHEATLNPPPFTPGQATRRRSPNAMQDMDSPAPPFANIYNTPHMKLRDQMLISDERAAEGDENGVSHEQSSDNTPGILSSMLNSMGNTIGNTAKKIFGTNAKNSARLRSKSVQPTAPPPLDDEFYCSRTDRSVLMTQGGGQMGTHRLMDDTHRLARLSRGTPVQNSTPTNEEILEQARINNQDETAFERSLDQSRVAWQTMYESKDDTLGGEKDKHTPSGAEQRLLQTQDDSLASPPALARGLQETEEEEDDTIIYGTLNMDTPEIIEHISNTLRAWQNKYQDKTPDQPLDSATIVSNIIKHIRKTYKKKPSKKAGDAISRIVIRHLISKGLNPEHIIVEPIVPHEGTEAANADNLEDVHEATIKDVTLSEQKKADKRAASLRRAGMDQANVMPTPARNTRAGTRRQTPAPSSGKKNRGRNKVMNSAQNNKIDKKLNTRVPLAISEIDAPESLLSSLPRLRRRVKPPDRYQAT